MSGKRKIEFTPEQMRQMAKLYESGSTLRELAEAFECSYSTIRARLLEYQTKMRPTGMREGTIIKP